MDIHLAPIHIFPSFQFFFFKTQSIYRFSVWPSLAGNQISYTVTRSPYRRALHYSRAIQPHSSEYIYPYPKQRENVWLIAQSWFIVAQPRYFVTHHIATFMLNTLKQCVLFCTKYSFQNCFWYYIPNPT